MRDWICSLESSTRSLEWPMRLSAVRQARAHGADVDVGSGSLSGNGMAKREVGNVLIGEKLAQPDTLGLVWVYRHVHPVAVIEAKGSVNRRLAHGAYRQWLGKTAGVGA